MPDLRQVLKEFVATANAGQYATENELISKFPELNGYDINALKEFVATANAGQYSTEDELLSKFPEFGVPVKKKEESAVPLWLQKQEQPKPKPEPALPFLESKPSGISLGSQRVPEAPHMFEAPPMRTPEQAQAIVETPEYKEEQFFTGAFGDMLQSMDTPWNPAGYIADFIDDFGRAVAQGSAQGDIVSPTSAIFLKGGKVSDEEISKFRKAAELAQKLGPSDEMVKFSEEYEKGGKTTSSFLKALVTNPGAIPEIMVSSYTAMANAPSLAAGGAAIGTGAAIGGAPGAVGAIPYAMAAMGATLETNASLAESIQNKLQQDGLEWNDENIRKVISDENFLKQARINAATRGVTIGAIDALTGRVAGKVGAKLLKAPKGGVAKSALAAGGIEAVGGSTGEATARALTGQEMDIAEIGLEGIAELPGTVVSVGSEVLKKPLYKVNGEVRPEADVKEIVETADGDQLAKINIEIVNDDKGYNDQIQDKVVSAQVKNEVKELNPDLDENTVNEITRLEMELKKVDGKKTQTAKDKAASIKSQIKTLQENAVQKPSTEEGVLRPEEPQVGLQEVGKGDTQEQAPTEEVVKEEVVTPDEELQAAFDRISIPEDTETLPGIDDELKTINESLGRVKEEVDSDEDERELQDLGEKVSRAKKKIATADDTDAAIEEFKQAEKEKSDFEQSIEKKKDFNKVDALIADEVYQKNRGGYEYQELFDQDPRLAAIQSAKETIELGKGDFLDEKGVARYENDIRILEEDIAKFPVKQAEPATKVSSKTPKAKAPKAKGVPIPVAIPKPTPAPAPAPAPAPIAVVSQPTTKAVGPEALRQEYINKINDVRLNQDKSRTPRQIDERVKELQAEYKKLKDEMTAPKPKAAPAPKAKEKASKAEVKEVPKSKFQQAQDFADKLSAMTEEERDDVEFDENYVGYQLFEARKLMPKNPNTTKFKKVDENNSSTLYTEYEYIANIDGEPYGLVKYEDPDDPDNDKAFVWAYEKVGTGNLFETVTDDNEELISEIKSQISKEQKTKPTPVSQVEEEEPSYDEVKDLDPTDETALKKILRKLDSTDNGLADFGRGNLSSGIAIPLARAIIKSLKVLVKAGITLQEAIERVAAENKLKTKDIENIIKEVDRSQTALKKLKDQIKSEVRSAIDSKKDVNQKRKDLSNVIKDMETTGKISSIKARAMLNKIGKLNLDSNVSVEKFIDYVGKIFSDAEYTSKLNTAKAIRSSIKKLSKDKDKFANLRTLGSSFSEIDPSMVENIDEYNRIASLIKESIKGSTTRKENLRLANMMKESDAMQYINDTMEAQRKTLLNQKVDEVQELLGIDASDLTYEQLVELVNDDKPLTKYNEGLIRAAINKAFDIYSSMIDASIRNGKDVFTDEDVEYSANQKRIVKEFMSMDLDVLKPKQAIEAVDALMNFLQNQSIAKMESVIAKYKGETEMRAIEKKGIKAKPISKYWSKGLGRLLLEQTANLNIVFERMFGGFTKGGMVEDAMGVSAIESGKSKAQSESNKIVDKYVKEFYNLKPNGEVFNTAENDIERGMTAFMMRNIVGTEAEMQSEFNRRKKLIEESIKVLAEGNELEVKKGKIYENIYNKILKDSKNIDDVVSKSSEQNNNGVKLWQNTWSDKYPELYDVALGVYNKNLGRDINFTPDRFAKLSSDPGEIDLTSEDMGFLVNSGNAPLYKKETGVLMTATRPESLPRNPNTEKPNRYVDLSFDRNNSNSYYDALVDINTAAPIRQVQSALNSDSFARIMKGTGDDKLLRNRIDLYVKNIRNKNPFSNDEFSKAVRGLNRIASIGVGQALGGVEAPIKQVIPIATNTLINAKGLDVKSVFDKSKQSFMDNSGYAIANRGIESQAQIESLNKMIEEAASSKPEQAFKAIEKINNWWLKNSLVKFDVAIARASWMTYYEKSLKEQGIDPATIDYNTHEINQKAADYAQRQVDRQQNVSDPDLAGALLSSKDAGKQLFVKVLMPFASFRMNQSARLGSDLSILTDKTATKEDKEIAARSLGGFAAEMVTFRLLSAGLALLTAAVVKSIMGRGDDEEKDKKKNDAIVKGQLTSTVADVFSPAPLVDKAIQMGASAVLDATQDALDVNEEDRLDIYSGNKQDFFQSLGLLGIAGSRVNQLYEMSRLAAGAPYEDDYGRKKYLSPEDRKAIALLIPIEIASNIGLAPSEVNKIIRSSLSDAKRNASTIEGGQKEVETKIMGLNKEDLKRYYPEVYEEYYGEGTEDAERRKLEQEENKLEREMKDEYYDYKPKREKSEGFKTGGFESKK